MASNFIDKMLEEDAILQTKLIQTQKTYDDFIEELTKKKISNVFKFGEKEIIITDEQSKIVYEKLNTNMLIIACAGSGKTTTTICRIKYLLDNGVLPDSIILITFTRDASNDMKHKLELLFGKAKAFSEPIYHGIEVGTIDSFAKKSLYKYAKDMVDNNISSVSEYSPKFLKFLQNHPNKELFMERFKYLIVDEFQDIDDTQFGIVNEFYKNGVNIVAVGDDAQNIYSFRGSNIEHILNFDKKINATRYTLTKNYRSTPEIIRLANCSIEKNKYQYPKKMINHHESRNIIPLVEYFHNMDQQNKFILEKILFLISKNMKLDEICILSLANEALFGLEELLTKNKIPNAYLDSKSDIKTKIKENHITLSTIHKAKGLEWSCVFIIGLNDELFPRKKTTFDIEESRRLFYVGITRAKQYLFLTFTCVYGKMFVTRFISEIDRNLYDFPKYNKKYIGLSEKTNDEMPLTVEALVENLDGNDYTQLKENKIIPMINSDVIFIHNQYTYLDFIKLEELYSDFGIFLDCLLCRMIGEIAICTLKYEPATRAIASVKLTPEEHILYLKYQSNFVNNLDKIGKTDNLNMIVNKLNTYDVKKTTGIQPMITQKDVHTLSNILRKMARNANTYNCSLSDIPLFTERFLPEDFETHMGDMLNKYSDKQISWKDLTSETWHLAKCNKIVNNKRRRLLYKDINIEELKNYNNLFTDMYDHFAIVFKDKNTELHKKINYEGVSGEINIIVAKTIITCKTSNENSIKGEWFVELLCYAYLCKMNGIEINKLQIYNPLQGSVCTIKIDDWSSGKELFDYLLEKRKKLMERNNNMQKYEKINL